MQKLYNFMLIAGFLAAGCSQADDDLGEPFRGGAPPTRAMQEQLRDPIRESIARSLEMGQLSYDVSENDARVLLDALTDEPESYELDYLVNEAETMLYVVNYTSAPGWRLLSTDKRTQPVLAYGQTGTFILDSLNPGEAIWLEEVYELLGELQNDGGVPQTDVEFIDEADPTWVDLAPATRSYNWQDDGEWVKEGQQTYNRVQQVGPLTKTYWHQEAPWNEKVPYSSHSYTTRCPAGCVALAGAQMLYYLHYLWGIPATMYEEGGLSGVKSNYGGSFSNSTSAAWDKMPIMPVVVDKDDPDPNKPDNKYVATLISYVGMKVDMDYAGGGSGAQTEDLGAVFNEFGIKSEFSDFKTRYVKPNLDNGIPTVVRAKSSKRKGKHAWIIDGYKQDYRVIVTTYRWYTYYTTDLGEGAGDIPKVTEEDLYSPVTYDTLIAQDLGITIAYPQSSRRRPKYSTEKTRTTSSTVSDGYFWYMNWGWGEVFSGNYYATLDKWEEAGYAYNKNRQMLLITGHK